MPSLLKSLELTGYKTFASKQRFEFSNAITAIVGPNGSGKSNIADAIRWVLGEQSYSLLRGRKTDDMIFSGSDKRSRSGMASATIVFDNTDGWLPIDFSEVSITRKAYRDGQNEYQINGSRVRLRDVNELLSQSGLSERTYTVIGQGLVDTALSLKADERRKLFEEAAGIGLYRSRKDQALKRLDNTKRNLERVWDILAELRPRLRSLERQAKRAEDYLQIQEDLKRTMREWYGYHWHKSQGDVQYTKTFAEKQERELATIKEKHQVLSTKLNTLRSRIQSNRINLNTWQQQLAEKHRQRENFSREIAVAKERIRSFESQIEQGQQEITRLEEEKKYRLEQYEQAEAVLNSMQKEHQEAEEQFSANKHKLDQINQERKELETRIEQLSQIIQDLKNQHALSSARIEEYQQRITEFDQQIIESNNEKESNARELSTLMEERTALETNRSKLEQQGKTLMETLDDTRKKINQTREQIDLIKRSIDSYQAENARFKAEQDVLQDAENNLTGYASGTKVLLDPANRSRFSSLGSLNKLISIEPAYEKAISGLLQLFVDAVILENENATDQALDFLEEKGVKTALIPLQNQGRKNAETHPDDPDIIGFANDLIQTEPQYTPLLQNLLRNCLVVKDKAAARRTVRKMDGEIKAATLKGEVFYSSGAIVVNHEEVNSGLARPRKIQEIGAKIKSNSSEIENLENELTQAQKELNRLETISSQTESEASSVSRMKAEIQQQFQNLEKNRFRFEQKAEWYSNQVQNFAEEINKTKELITRERQKATENDERIENIHQQQREQKEELAGIDPSEIERQVSHWRMIQTLGEEKLNNAREIFSERKNALEGTLHSIQQLTERIEQNHRNISEIHNGISSSAESEKNLQNDIGQTEEKINPAQAELEKLETEYSQVQADEEQARNSLNIAERHNNQAQMAYMRQQEAFSSLRERIQDDFGLVSFQYDENISGPTPLPLNGYVEELPVITELSENAEANMKALRNQLRRLGSINPEAHQEYQEVKDRHTFLTEQSADLEKAEADIRAVITELDELMQVEFHKTFEVVAREFKTIFTRLFGGGHAQLVLTNEEEISEAGIEIEAKLPGKRTQRLSMLSGGERSLTAAALVFSLIKASPTPFCVMDEVDAALDESNVGRFCDLLDELSQNTQFVVITHNRNTVQTADVIYGITMGKDTASQTISLKLEDVDETYSV